MHIFFFRLIELDNIELVGYKSNEIVLFSSTLPHCCKYLTHSVEVAGAAATVIRLVDLVPGRCRPAANTSGLTSSGFSHRRNIKINFCVI